MRLLIKQRVFSWTDSYDVYDENETKLATAQAKVEKSNAGMSAAYDKLLTTLGLTDEQFKLTYGNANDNTVDNS